MMFRFFVFLQQFKLKFGPHWSMLSRIEGQFLAEHHNGKYRQKNN